MFEYVEHKDSAHTYRNLAPYEIVSLSICLGLHSAGCDEDIDPGEEGGERPLPQQLHLHVYQEVFGLADLSLQEDSACVAVQLPGAEVALLVAPYDADDDMVARVGRGRSDSKDLGWDDDVGLEAELVVGDPQRRVLTVYRVNGTADALTASENQRV